MRGKRKSQWALREHCGRRVFQIVWRHNESGGSCDGPEALFLKSCERLQVLGKAAKWTKMANSPSNPRGKEDSFSLKEEQPMDCQLY